MFAIFLQISIDSAGRNSAPSSLEGMALLYRNLVHDLSPLGVIMKQRFQVAIELETHNFDYRLECPLS